MEWVLNKERAKNKAEQWKCLKNACNKIVHVSIDGVDDEEMPILVKNLLVIANLLLILDYGLQPTSSLRFVIRDPVKQKEHETGSRAAMENFWQGSTKRTEAWRTPSENGDRRAEARSGA